MGGFDATEKLLLRVLDADRVAAIMQEIRGPAGRTVWDKLAHVNEAVLASYLKNEYPQTVAVVLSRIEPAHAARVLANLPDDFATEVVMRMLRMEVVQNEIVADVERTLRAEFMSNLARTNRRDNHELMAEIFNYFDRATETRFLNSLEDRNKETADRIKALMFTFEDLAKLDPAGIQTLMRSAGNDRIAIALKGASEQLRELFFKNMSERGRQDPARRHAVDRARFGCATSRRPNSSWSTWPRSSPRPARSSCWTARTMSWSTESRASWT